MSAKQMMNFDDVRAFHEHYGVPQAVAPTPLHPDDAGYRVSFMQEELDEYVEAVKRGDLAGQFDALLDLVYVAMGTAIWQGFPWQQGWNEVQRANMAKERVASADVSKRGHAWDIVKPAGWAPPDIEAVLTRARTHAQVDAAMRACPDEPTR